MKHIKTVFLVFLLLFVFQYFQGDMKIHSRQRGRIPINTKTGEESEKKFNLKSMKMRHYNFTGGNFERSMWSGLYCASNGKIYIGLSTHGDAAYVYEFDPATEEMTQLADLTRLAGERGKGIWTTGKIHVQMQELDGYVYFGALDEDSGPPAIDASSYEGPHWYRINLRTSEV